MGKTYFCEEISGKRILTFEEHNKETFKNTRYEHLEGCTNFSEKCLEKL